MEALSGGYQIETEAVDGDLASLPSSSSSSQLPTRKKVWKPIDSPASSNDYVSSLGLGEDGSTLTPEGSIITEEVLGNVNLIGQLEVTKCPGVAEAMPSAYSIDLDRTSGTRLGMSILEHVGQTLLVTAVTGGLCQEWNTGHAGTDVQVRPGDRIVVVNGCRCNTRLLLEECKKNQVLHMAILRPPCQELAPGVHSVALDKTSGMKLGIDISQHDGRTLLVTEIREGLVKEWNRENPCHQIRPGDRILKVNSCQNSSKRLLEECRKNVVLRIAIKKAKVRTSPSSLNLKARLATDPRL